MVGLFVGMNEGCSDGEEVGALDGAGEGRLDGEVVREAVGTARGVRVEGGRLGFAVDEGEGSFEGVLVINTEGAIVGRWERESDGIEDGRDERLGESDIFLVGEAVDGLHVGFSVEIFAGKLEGEGDGAIFALLLVGLAVGVLVEITLEGRGDGALKGFGDKELVD
jgi:hypothetical protein